jgi:hypothetical protein
VRLANKRANIDNRKNQLERLRVEYLKCLPNIEENLEMQKRNEQELNTKVDAEINEKLSRSDMFRERLEFLYQ